MKIGILETGPTLPALEPRFGRVHRLFIDFFDDTALAPEFDVFEVYTGEFPDNVAACDGYVVTGSRFSVLDGDDWIARLKHFVVEASSTRPILGICFGHQLVAEAFGGKVVHSGLGFTAGVVTYQMTEEGRDGLPSYLTDSLSFFASHGDVVERPPEGATVLAGGPTSPNGMMAVGPNVLTIQLHPEWTADYAGALYEVRREALGDAFVDKAIASLVEPVDGALFKRLAVEHFSRP